jgi:hypothetical protein
VESSLEEKDSRNLAAVPSPVDAAGVGEVQRAFDRLHAMANENARKEMVIISGGGFTSTFRGMALRRRIRVKFKKRLCTWPT